MEKRLIFLQKFTEELIINSMPEELKSLPTQKEILVTPIKKPVSQKMIPSIMHKTQKPIQKQIPLNQQTQFSQQTGEWGKITQLIYNPNIISIESSGPGKVVIVRNRIRAMPTNILLESEDIEEVIDKFSRESRIPRIGGIFKAIVNGLTINAIDSDVGGSRFIITKMQPRFY